MLFYERIPEGRSSVDEALRSPPPGFEEMDTEQSKVKIELSKELNEWIWHDNMQFLQVRAAIFSQKSVVLILSFRV